MSDQKKPEKRIIIVGNVDSGKSTLIGVLSGGELDDGRGKARLKLKQHKHEIETGRTSSIGHSSIPGIILLDAPGHERYNKTTAKGMSKTIPDYVICLVAANLGLTRMTREHLGMAVLQDLPVLVLITKIDMAPDHIRKKTIKRVKKLLGKTGRKHTFLNSKDEINKENLLRVSTRKLIPVLCMSSVTGENIDTLKYMLDALPDWRNYPIEDNTFSFSIDSKFLVPGIGVVVGGIVRTGQLKVGATCWLGPYARGKYNQVKVRSIYVTDEPNNDISAGQYGTLAVKAIDGKKLTKASIRDGMILTDCKYSPSSTIKFIADIKIMHHSTTIKSGYSPLMHCRGIRQCFHMMDIEKLNIKNDTDEKGYLRTETLGRIKCKFIKNYEYLEEEKHFYSGKVNLEVLVR